MHSFEDTRIHYEEDGQDLIALQKPMLNPAAARRSVERLLEQRALRSRLTDELGNEGSFDDLDW